MLSAQRKEDASRRSSEGHVQITRRGEGKSMLSAVKMGLGSYPLSVKQIKEMTGEGASFIYKKIAEIREQIRLGRYNEYALVEEKSVRVNYYVYYDYSTYRERLLDKNLRKLVPPFDARKIAEINPVMQELVIVEGKSA